MLELTVAIVCLAIGFVGGVWMRRSAIQDFQRGVELGLSHMPMLVKAHQQPQQQRHDNNQKPQQSPAQK